jgi:cysteinyl-tRNA synthetase
VTLRPFQVYDSLSRSVRRFAPLNPPRVGLFVCGLTPYAEAHIGHGRTAVTFDVVARALRRWGYRVFYVQNVTNLDDKVIARAAQEGTEPLALADRHFAQYAESIRRLGVRSVNVYPFATDYMPEIIAQIDTLVRRGFAYPAGGSVYYEVAKFPAYGRLSGQRLEEQRPGTRIEADPHKRAPEDFALWKAATPGEPSWESPWGPGRPGWHIEDTAITVRLLGARYDLHGGGLELKFPHHEAEIAQAEAATGESPLVNYWMHAGLLTMKGEKMAKSLGNVVPLDRAISEHGGEVLRFYYLNAVYRNPLDYESGRTLEEADAAYRALLAPYRRIEEELARGGRDRAGLELPSELAGTALGLPEELDAILAEDFQTREAIAALFAYGRTLGPWLEKLPTLSGNALAELGAPYRWAAEVLGLGESAEDEDGGADLGPVVEVALTARARARARGDYAEADRIRADLAAAGITVEDGSGATRWSRADARAP